MTCAAQCQDVEERKKKKTDGYNFAVGALLIS